MRDRTNTRTRILLAVLSGLVVLVAGCRNTSSSAGGPNAQKRGRVVLEVEGTAFTADDFDAYVRSTTGGDGRSRLEAAALSRLFDGFVDEKILLRRAQDKGVTLSDEEKASYLAKLRSATEGEGQPGVRPRADDQAVFERLLVEKYLFQVSAGIAVDNKAVAEFYNAHKGDYLQPEKVQVSQILLASEGQASEVRERLKTAGEAEFRAAARAESAGPEGAKGGVMGAFSLGQLPQELEKNIFPLKEGEISRIVVSTYGYHIFRLDKKFEARLLTLQEASPSIRAKLLDEKSTAAVAAHLEELKTSMDWKARPENLPFAYQRIPI